MAHAGTNDELTVGAENGENIRDLEITETNRSGDAILAVAE